MVDAALAKLRDALAADTALQNVTVEEDFVWGEATFGGNDHRVIVTVDPETDAEPATDAELVERVVELLDTSEDEFDDIAEGLSEDLAEFGLTATADEINDDLYLRSVVIYADLTLLQYLLPEVAEELRVHVEIGLDGTVEGVAISTAEDDEDDYLDFDGDELDYEEEEDEDDDERPLS